MLAMKIRIKDFRDTTIELVLLTALIDLDYKDFEKSDLDVELKVDGKEVNMVKVFERLQLHMEVHYESGRKEGREDAKHLLEYNMDELLSGWQKLVGKRMDKILFLEDYCEDF